MATIANVIATICLGVTTRSIPKQQTTIQQQQADTSTRQFRLGLFEKRMAVYDSTMGFLAKVPSSRQTVLPEMMDLLTRTKNHEFLFGPEVTEFIEKSYEQARQLHSKRLMHERQFTAHSLDPSSQRPPTTEELSQETEILIWFADQLRNAKEVFLPYMDFRQP